MRGFSIEKSKIICPKVSQIVCEYFGLREDEVYGKGREAVAVKARGFIIYLLHRDVGVTIPFLCSFFNRAKRTILWHCSQMETFIKLYDSYRKDYTILCEKMDSLCI